MGVYVEPTEVADSITMLSVRTPTLPPATHTNAYLIGSREFVLLEPASAYADEVDKIVAWVDARLGTGAQLRGIVLTHHHYDHVAGAAQISQRLGAPIWAHAKTMERLMSVVPVARTLEDGECITLDGERPVTLEAIHTPGHAPGHLCLLARESGAMFAGDMVASVGTILVEPTDGDMQLYLKSLTEMAARNPQQLLPAHGLPIVDPQARLSFYVQHRLAREAKVYGALVGVGRAARVDELVPVAYADTPQVAWPLARLSAEAHLIKLEREGQVVRVGELWRVA